MGGTSYYAPKCNRGKPNVKRKKKAVRMWNLEVKRLWLMKEAAKVGGEYILPLTSENYKNGKTTA